MIRPQSIDHVCLWVRCLREAKEYYEKLFSVECRPREGDADTLIVESADIHFFITQDAALPHTFLARQHLSFRVSSLADVIRHLELLNITDHTTGEVSFMQHRNYRWCEWRDPSGVRLECVEWSAAES